MTGEKRRDSFLEADSTVADPYANPTEPDTTTKDAEWITPQDREDEDIEPTASMTYVTILATPASSPDTSTPTSPFLPSNPPQPTLNLLCNSSPAPLTLPSALLAQHSRLFRTLGQDASHPLIATPTSPLHLNIDHEAFTVFARWLRGGKIHVPFGDENGFATDLYLLMRAHAAGEALGADVFADMCLDEIIGELVEGEDGENGDETDDDDSFTKLDARSKACDLEILLQAAAAIWPAGSLGRELLVDWYVHSPACAVHNLTTEAVVELGDLDLAARCMVRGKEAQMAGVGRAPYLVDPCRYHQHRALGLPCYKRSPGSVYSGLEYAVRCGMVGWGEEDGESEGSEGDGVTLCEYEECVKESLELFGGDDVFDVN